MNGIEKETKKYNGLIGLLLIGVFLIFNGILLAGHEQWRDEANVWLIARDLSPVGIFREMRYQGHPFLWYYLVMPFAKLGFPFQTINILSFLIMGTAAAVFALRAPFTPVTKGICLLSPIFSYYYPVVARNYCLIALLLILLAVFHDKRDERPIRYGLMLGALVQADTIAIAAAGTLSLMWAWQAGMKAFKQRNKRPFLNAIKGLWIPLASFLLWILEFWQVSDSPEYGIRQMGLGELLREIRNFAFSILIRMTGQNELFCRLFFLAVLVLGLILSIRLKSFWPLLVLMLEFLTEIIFSIMVYQLHIWHYIVLAFTLLWFLWWGNESQKSGLVRTGTELLLIVLAVTMFVRWNSPEENSSLSNALHGLYSDAGNVAKYMRGSVEEDALIFSTDVSECSTPLAHLGKNYTFYYAGSGEKASFAQYTREQQQTITWTEFERQLRDRFPAAESYYILQSPTNCITDIPEEAKSRFTLLYETKEATARGESYALYEVGREK